MPEPGHIRGACFLEMRTEVHAVLVLAGQLGPGSLCHCVRHSPEVAKAGTGVPVARRAERLRKDHVRDPRCNEKLSVHSVLAS